MLKKTYTYTDYDGNQRTEDFYFNLTLPELRKMYNSVPGGLDKKLEKIVASMDTGAIMEVIDEFIRASYGEKSLDGRRFMKSEEIYKAFSETEAYAMFYSELLSSDAAASEFILGVLPKNVSEGVGEQMTTRKLAAAALPLASA